MKIKIKPKFHTQDEPMKVIFSLSRICRSIRIRNIASNTKLNYHPLRYLAREIQVGHVSRGLVTSYGEGGGGGAGYKTGGGGLSEGQPEQV